MDFDDSWVKKNYDRGVYNYLKEIAKEATKRNNFFIPVQPKTVEMDTRHVTHVKFGLSPKHNDEKWYVRYQNSKTPEQMDEEEVLKTMVAEPTLNMIKALARNKHFVPIPAGSACEARLQEQYLLDRPILYQQHGEATCAFFSLANACHYIGIPHLVSPLLAQAEAACHHPNYAHILFFDHSATYKRSIEHQTNSKYKDI